MSTPLSLRVDVHCNKVHSCPSIAVKVPPFLNLTLSRPGGEGAGICTQAGSSFCCAEMVSSRKLKLSDFYFILIGLNSEYKPVPWDIHCCHGNAIVEGCSVKIEFFCSNRFLVSV